MRDISCHKKRGAQAFLLSQPAFCKASTEPKDQITQEVAEINKAKHADKQLIKISWVQIRKGTHDIKVQNT